MKAIVNALQYKSDSSGIGVMIRELFGRLPQHISYEVLFILSKNSPCLAPFEGQAKNIRASCLYEQGMRRMFFQTFIMGYKYCNHAVLLTTDSKIPLFIPKSCCVIPLVTDLALYRVNGAYQISRTLLWRIQYRYLKHRANHFLAVSECTKQDLISILGIPDNKIDVIPCAASEAMVPVTDCDVLNKLKAKYSLPRQYILFVGNHNPRKNLRRLMSAFAMARERGITHHLVIAGEHGWKFNKDDALKEIQPKDDIHFLGYVPDEDMPALYSGASLFVFPTLYEGFGIPVIEAQRCGTPVLTSSCSALPEVGGNAAIYVDPQSTSSICDGIVSVLSDPGLADRLVQAGFRNAQRFSWNASAQQLGKIIEGVIRS